MYRAADCTWCCVPEFDEDIAAMIAEGQPFLDAMEGAPAVVEILDNDLGLDVPGGPLVADFDDDDENGAPDYCDGFFKPHDDLYTVNLAVPEARKGKSVTLTAPSSMVRIWTEGGQLLIGSDKATGKDSVTWDGTQAPDKVLMEVIAGSGREGDIVLTLWADGNIDSAWAARTAVGVKMIWVCPPKGVPDSSIVVEAGSTVPDVLVGDNINASVSIEAPRAWIGGAAYQWASPPGKVFKAYVVDAVVNRRQYGYVVPFERAKLVTPDISFVWADGGNNRQIGVSVNINGLTIRRSTNVNVVVPNTTVYDISLGKARYGEYSDGPTFGLLDNLNDLPANSLAGIMIIAQVNVPASRTGEWAFVQLGKPGREGWDTEGTYWWWGPEKWRSPDERDREFGSDRLWGLDSIFPFKWNKWGGVYQTGQGGGFVDSPNQPLSRAPLFDYYHADESYVTYILFRPKWGEWVPLMKVAWGYAGRVERIDGSFDYRELPGTPDQWVGQMQATSDHPTWTWNFKREGGFIARD